IEPEVMKVCRPGHDVDGHRPRRGGHVTQGHGLAERVAAIHQVSEEVDAIGQAGSRGDLLAGMVKQDKGDIRKAELAAVADTVLVRVKEYLSRDQRRDFAKK